MLSVLKKISEVYKMQKNSIIIIITIIMLLILTWIFRMKMPSKLCLLKGEFLYLQELHGLKFLRLQSYPQGTKREIFWSDRWDDIYYQIAPDQKRVLVEVHRGEETTLFLVHLLSNKTDVLITASGIKAAIWLNNHKIAFWQSGLEKHLNLKIRKLSSLRSINYLSFLQHYFRKEIEHLNKVLSSRWFWKERQLERENENNWQASLMFLRTIGVPLEPPLLNAYIDVLILGREASLSPDGRTIIYTTSEGALCVRKRSERILINPPSQYCFFHPRWIDKNHVIVGLSRLLDVPSLPPMGEWVLGIVHLHHPNPKVEIVACGYDGKWLKKIK